MRPPARILPLAAIAIGGVIAFKTLDAVGGVGALFPDAAAHAEEAHASTKPGAGAKPAPAAAAPVAGAATAPQSVAPKPPAPACAVSPAELARQAGLSPNELQIIQSLSTRRGQLDARESQLDAQLQLLAAAEAKVDAKIKAMDAAKASIQTLLGQADAQSQAEIDRLVTVYEKMKPRDAGALMAQLDDKVRVPVAAKMKPAVLAQVLPAMGSAEAKRLTENLARRYAAVREQVAAALAPPAASTAGKPAAPAPPAAAQAVASSDPVAAPAAKPAAKPQRVARAAPRKPRPAPSSAPAKAEAASPPPAAAPVAAAKPAAPPAAAPAPAAKPAP